MATISISTALASTVSDALTKLNIGTSVKGMSSSESTAASEANSYRAVVNNNLSLGSIFANLPPASGGYQQGFAYVYTAAPTWATISFRNSSEQVLTQYSVGDLARSIDASGYVTLSNFPPKIPILAGTVSTIIIATNGDDRTITFTVGAPSGSSDVQFDDRTLVSNQPWRLDGSIRFRVPVSYDYTV